MKEYIPIILGAIIVCAAIAAGRRAVNIAVRDKVGPVKAKWIRGIGWILEGFIELVILMLVVEAARDYVNGNVNKEAYIDMLKRCTFQGTTDTVGNVFSAFYGNLEWSLKDPAEKEKNHKYIVMTGQCYQEAAMADGRKLVDVEIIFDARKTMDDYYQFSRLYGLVNGVMLSDEEFSALIEDTYGPNMDITNMFDDGLSAGLSNFADFYISEMNKRIFSGKYISYYYDDNDNTQETEAEKTRFMAGDQVENMQRALQGESGEMYEEPQEWSDKPDTWSDEYSYEEYTDQADANGSSEYIFWDSDIRLLTDGDVAGLSSEDLRIAKNEIYARHGRMFTSEDLKAYFESKSWYQGYIAAEQFSESVFNQTEKDNIAFIQKYIDNPSGTAGDEGYRLRGLAVNDPQAIPQIAGTYHYYSDTSDKNRISMELNVEGNYAYVSFNEDGHQYQRSIDLYNINDQEYVSETGDVGIYFDDYGKKATYYNNVDGGLNGTYTYLP